MFRLTGKFDTLDWIRVTSVQWSFFEWITVFFIVLALLLLLCKLIKCVTALWTQDSVTLLLYLCAMVLVPSFVFHVYNWLIKYLFSSNIFVSTSAIASPSDAVIDEYVYEWNPWREAVLGFGSMVLLVFVICVCVYIGKIIGLQKLFSGGQPRQSKEAGGGQSTVVVNNNMTLPDPNASAVANIATTGDWKATLKALTQQLGKVIPADQQSVAVHLAAFTAAVEASTVETTVPVAPTIDAPSSALPRRRRRRVKKKVTIVESTNEDGKQSGSEMEESESEVESTKLATAIIDKPMQRGRDTRPGTVLRGTPASLSQHISEHLQASGETCELFVPAVYITEGTDSTMTTGTNPITSVSALGASSTQPVLQGVQAREGSSKKLRLGEYFSDQESEGTGYSYSDREDTPMQVHTTGSRPYGPAGERFGNAFAVYPNTAPFPHGNTVNRGGRRSRSPATGANTVAIPKRDLPTIVPPMKDEFQPIEIAPAMENYIREYVQLPWNVREGGYLSPQEKRMSARELYLFWRRAGNIIGGRDARLIAKDDIPFDELTEHERSLPKKEVKKILYSKRNHAWHLLEVAKGRKTYFCGNCSRYHPEGLSCTFRQYDRRNHPEGSGLLTQTSARGFTVVPAGPIVDYDELMKEQQKLSERIFNADRERKQAAEMALGVQTYDERRKAEIQAAHDSMKAMVATQVAQQLSSATASPSVASSTTACTNVPTLNQTVGAHLATVGIQQYIPTSRRFSEVCTDFRTGELQQTKS